MPLIRIAELRHPLCRRREPASPMPSFEPSSPDLRRVPSPCPVSAQLSRHDARGEAFLPPVSHANLQVCRVIPQSVGRQSSLRASRCIRASLFLDNRLCGAGLQICLGGGNRGLKALAALADGVRITSEQGTPGSNWSAHVNDRTVSAAIGIGQWLLVCES